MKAFILGAAGILGYTLSQRFQETHVSFVGFTHTECDITQANHLKQLLEKHRPDIVFNTAAMTAVDRCETDQKMAFAINAEAPGHLAHLCRERKIRLVHISTDYVFDGQKKAPYSEDDIPSPISVYAASKLEGEKRVMEEDPSALVVRVAWVFRAGGRTFLCRLREMVLEQEHLKVANDRIGNCTYACDLAFALEALVKKNASGLVHVTNEGELSWFDFAVALKEEARSGGFSPRCREILPISSQSLNLPARRPIYSVLDKSRYRQLTGNSMRPWRETIIDFLHEKISIS